MPCAIRTSCNGARDHKNLAQHTAALRLSTRLSTFNCPSTLRSFASYRLNKFSSSVIVVSNCCVFLFSFFQFLLICISMRNCYDAHNLAIKGSKFLKLTLPIISLIGSVKIPAIPMKEKCKRPIENEFQK